MSPATAETDAEDAVAGHVGEEERVDRAEKPTSVNLRVDDLPAPLQEVADELDAALNDDPPPIDMGEGNRYKEAPDVSRVARVLIRELHDELEGLDFRCCFRGNVRSGGEKKAATVSTPPGRWKKWTGIDFYIDVALPSWNDMSAAERIRVVDHELCHLEADEDGVTTGGHEIEEFAPIIRRWGWAESQKEFGRTASQIEMGL